MFKSIQMKRVCSAFLLILITLAFTQCQRDLSHIGSPDTAAPLVLTPDPIKSTLQGNITDENNQPAAGVVITVGGQTTTSNATGYFRITDASLDKNSSLVVAEKTGYFKAYRVFGATSGTNQVMMKLMKKTLVGTITGSVGGTASLSIGAVVALPANAVVDATSGVAYAGVIRVYAAYIDPTSSEIGAIVPGSFMGNDRNGGRVILSSYGMLAVELESVNGAKLQIKQGSVATLSTPIPASLLATATANIPLWFVDEKTGIWQEEGTATKQGNMFVGEVKHFSYWNCDYAGKAVSITLTLKTTSGSPLVNTYARFKADGGGVAHGYTDSLGAIRGMVPAGKTLVFEVLDACNNIVYTQSIPPLNSPTELGTITLSNSTPALVTFQGKIVDCNNAPVKTGYALITYNNGVRYARTNANGEFSVTFANCSGVSGNAQILAVDETAQQQNTSTTLAVTAPVTNAATLTACGTSSVQFINYTVDGVDYKLGNINTDSLYAFPLQSNLNIFGSRNTGTPNLLSFVTRNVTNATTYPVAELQVLSYRKVILKAPFNVDFKVVASILSPFYEGTLSGKFTADSSATEHTLSASFKVRRN